MFRNNEHPRFLDGRRGGALAEAEPALGGEPGSDQHKRLVWDGDKRMMGKER
jgi:hypothetical protein